jgi:hypothetical protein
LHHAPLDAKDFFLLEGARDVSFCFFILGKGDNYESFYFDFGSRVAFCVMTHFMVLFGMQGLVNVQK